MALRDETTIDDLDSFNEATLESNQLAGVYFFYMLDCLIELAYRVANDFFDRPHLYTSEAVRGAAPGGGVTERTSSAPILAKLHARYGCDEKFLGTNQREQIYTALFGSRSVCDGVHEDGDFARLRDELLEACAVYAETKFGDEDALRENIRQKHRLFKEFVEGQDGDSLDWTRREALAELTEQTCYTILRSLGVARVFTGSRPPRAEWPYDFDSNADKLIEEISRQLNWPPRVQYETSTAVKMATPEHASIAREVKPYITREDIVCRQRAALSGAVALVTVVGISTNSSDDDINLLTKRCYAWRTALKCVKGYTRAYAAPIEAQAPGTKVGSIALGQPMFAVNRRERR